MSNIHTTIHPDRPRLWTIPERQISAHAVAAKSNILTQRLIDISERFFDIRFATSLAAEDIVLTDAITKTNSKIKLFTLDTGRLHPETINLAKTVSDLYDIHIQTVAPSERDITAFIADYGINGFYEGEAPKIACCAARKIKPLNAALLGADAWLSGQRREQSATRTTINFEEVDATRGITKFNPLFDWTEIDLWSYIKHQNLPIHPLHFKGYPSIGCEPCTRPVREGEDIRAGRWWWLHSNSKECGLHDNQLPISNE